MRSHTICLALLTVIFVATYSVNMLVAEMYFEEVGDIMQFVLLKYCVGTLHHLLSPLAVLVSYPEVTPHKMFVGHIFALFGQVRGSAMRAYHRGGTSQQQTKIISAEKVTIRTFYGSDLFR